MEGNEGGRMKEIRKLYSMVLFFLLVLSLFSMSLVLKSLLPVGKAGNISSDWHNTSTLNISVVTEIPRVNWYDFQYNDSGTWVSRLNQRIDVNETAEYRFIINISSDQGWGDIDYINVTAWYDNGSESSTYNQTQGGNYNIYIRYENTTGTPSVQLIWPDDEITFTDWSETNTSDVIGFPGATEAHNLTFCFIPSYQLRYARGPSSGWDTNMTYVPKNYSWSSLYNAWSWNFNLSVTDASENMAWVTDEFGVYAYAEVVQVGWPTIVGSPGENVSATNITLITRSNGNYSLSVNLTNAIHEINSAYNISNQSIYLRGGNKSSFGNFGSGQPPLYLYGDSSSYSRAETNGTNKTSTNVEYRCAIPLGTNPGVYHSNIYYHLRTET
jgi:hypothetical protein